MPLFTTPQDRILGNPLAQVELLVFGDFQCPACAAVSLRLINLLDRFEGKLCYAFRPFPRPHLYPYALLAAQAAEAAAEQGQYWRMHQALFLHQSPFSLNGLYDLAVALGLDLRLFHAHMQNESLREAVIAESESGRRLGIRTTPAYFINGNRQGGTPQLGDLLETICQHTGLPPNFSKHPGKTN
jgi:protein-disulfide isomerase